MIKILSFFALATVVLRAAGPADKFDLSIDSVVLNGNAVEFTLKITNKSAVAASVDLSSDLAIVKGTSKDPKGPVATPTLRPGVYKPQLVILTPSEKLLFSTSQTSRAFAPKTLAPGESFTVTKSIPVHPDTLAKEMDATSFEVLGRLLFESAVGAAVERTEPSPTYTLTKAPDGKLTLTPE